MFALWIIGMTCGLLASSVSGEAEADPQFLYNPYPVSYWNQPLYYYPSYTYQPIYHYPTVNVKKVEKVETKKHKLRPIIPFFGGLRTRTAPQVSYLRPEDVPEVQQVQNDKIVTYSLPSVPYTQAYLNRVPASNFF